MYQVKRNLKNCYKLLTGLLNKHYRDELLEIENVKRGKFILEYDPETGDPNLCFRWWNDFGLEEPEELTEEWEENFDKVWENKIRPTEKRVWDKIEEIKGEFVDDFFPDISGFHEINEENYEIELDRDKANLEDDQCT